MASGLAHLVHFERSRAAVAVQHVVSTALSGPLVAALAVAELALGGGTLVAVTSGSSSQTVWGLLCASLFVAFGGYAHLAWLRRTHRDVQCACGVGEAPLGLWVTLRSGLLAALALVGALFASPGGAWLDRPAFELMILGCAAMAMSVAVTLLPAARAPLSGLNPEVIG